jgi:hypothetical protein
MWFLICSDRARVKHGHANPAIIATKITVAITDTYTTFLIYFIDSITDVASYPCNRLGCQRRFPPAKLKGETPHG